MIATFVPGVIFDALVMVLTIHCAGRLAIQTRRVGIYRSLSYILLRDGEIGFFTVCDSYIYFGTVRHYVLQV